jgi:site-specific recombinase XerD
VPVGPDDYVIPNRRPASVRRKERSSRVIWETVRRVATRANVRSHAHALRAAFAVHFDETYPDQILTLKDLLGHARLETTLVYLRRRKKQLAMERVRGLSWGSAAGFVLHENAEKAHTGFEPVLPA